MSCEVVSCGGVKLYLPPPPQPHNSTTQQHNKKNIMKNSSILRMGALCLSIFTISISSTFAQNQQKVAKGKKAVIKSSEKEKFPPSYVDYGQFSDLTQEVQGYRLERLVDFETFFEMAAEEGTILLDTRSKKAYVGKHLKGAVHLNFSDFTEEKLAQLIPSKETRILIYCNNNFLHDPLYFPPKRMSLALNVPTFINLYGYGYKNIYELSDRVRVDHEKLVFEGVFLNDEAETTIKSKSQ